MATSVLKDVTDSTFDTEVMKKPGLHLVDFWAEWCAPCKAMVPSLEALQQTYAGKVSIVKVDTVENTQVAEQFRVRSLPTMFLIKDGKVVDQLVGAMSKAQIDARITKALS